MQRIGKLQYDLALTFLELANSLKGVSAIHLEPYHPLGLSKAQQLGRAQPYENGGFLPSAALQPFADCLRASTKTEVVIL